jgi:hypothetical protein
LFGLRIAEIKRSMAEYARQPDEYGRIVQHEQRIVGPLRKVKDAMQLLGQPLENESSAAERTQQIDKRNALQTFNDDLTPFAASFSGLEKGVGGLVELHRLLAPLVRITGATASLGSRPPPQSLAKLDEHLDRAIASFGDVFDAASRGLPEWLAHGSSVGANLEANWKETIGAAIRLLLPDLLKVQNTVVLAHELIARAAIGKISTELVATRRAINEALNSSSNTGSTNSVELGPHAVGLRNNLSEFLSAANLYRDFSCRLDDTLARTNDMLEKLGVDGHILVPRHADLLDSRTRADFDAISLFRLALVFSRTYDPNYARFDPNAHRDFDEALSRMETRTTALQDQVLGCWKAFPNASLEQYTRDDDRFRRPVLDKVAQCCDEIETDLMWMRDRVKQGNVGHSPADLRLNEGILDLLEGAISSVRRDLQWNISLTDEAKRMLANGDIPLVQPVKFKEPPSEREVHEYVKQHFPNIEFGFDADPPEHEPDLSWAEARVPTVSNTVAASRRATPRQRAARKAKARAEDAKRATNAEDASRALANVRQILQPAARDSCMNEITEALDSAARLVTRAREEVGREQLSLLSGSSIRQRFMQAVDALDAGRHRAEKRIQELDASLSTITEFDRHGVTETDRHSAQSQRKEFAEQIRVSSSQTEAIHAEAATEENRRNMKRFAQKPTRELFLWLTCNDPHAINAVTKTIERKPLAARARGEQPNGREDFLDEYTIKLRQPQRITYLDSNNGTQHARVDNVVLHVHYAARDANRPTACHFKNAAQAPATGAGVYRSTDSAALMADVLKTIDAMSRRTSTGRR